MSASSAIRTGFCAILNHTAKTACAPRQWLWEVELCSPSGVLSVSTRKMSAAVLRICCQLQLVPSTSLEKVLGALLRFPASEEFHKINREKNGRPILFKHRCMHDSVLPSTSATQQLQSSSAMAIASDEQIMGAPPAHAHLSNVCEGPFIDHASSRMVPWQCQTPDVLFGAGRGLPQPPALEQ